MTKTYDVLFKGRSVGLAYVSPHPVAKDLKVVSVVPVSILAMVSKRIFPRRTYYGARRQAVRQVTVVIQAELHRKMVRGTAVTADSLLRILNGVTRGDLVLPAAVSIAR